MTDDSLLRPGRVVMADWPLHGRDRELDRLSRLLEDPASRGIVLSGPTGVGKTRLGVECLRLARDRGMAVERISATFAASSLPLGAVLLSRPAREAPSESPTDQAELVHRTAADIIRHAGGRRLVVLVDDVHWLDQLSAVMIHQLAVTGSAVVILTSRTGSTAPDPVLALWKDGIVERMEVGAIDRSAFGDLVEAILGGPVAGAALAELLDRCGGNILFLRECVASALDAGQLTRDAGVWRLDSGTTSPPRLVELVEQRLDGLQDLERECLQVVAFGEPLELEDAVRLSDAEVIDGLDVKGLISVRPDGWGGATVALAHPLVGEVLRAGTTAIRARLITETLATSAEERAPHTPDSLLRVATWRLVSGGGSPQLMHDAAVVAYARHDYDLTVRLARAAIAAGAGFASKLLISEALGFSGHGDEAERMMADLATEASEDGQLAAVAQARMVNAQQHGDPAVGLRVYREALEKIDDPRLVAELNVRRAWLAIVQDGPRGALNIIRNLPSGSGGPQFDLAISFPHECAVARSGRTSEALDMIERGRALQAALTEPFGLHEGGHDVYACDALALSGRIEEYAANAETAYAQAVRSRSASAQLYASYNLARLNLMQGHVRTAARLAGESVGVAHQINDPNLLVAALSVLAESQVLQGDTEGAARCLAEIDSRPAGPWSLADAAPARAWLASARGNPEAAQRFLDEGAERALNCDDLREASLALHTLVRLGRPDPAQDRLEWVAERVEGDLVRTQSRHASALRAGDAEELELVGAAFESHSLFLLAAEAYAQAFGAWSGLGKPKRAAAAASRAEILVDRCEGAQTPALSALNARVALSEAETRTAMMVAAGKSNKEIAAAEQVSVRTVESRLQCVYAKLGLSSRQELADQMALRTGEAR